MIDEQGSASAKRWALRALTRRMHTVREIRTGLKKRGFQDSVIEEVLEQLVDLNYLDDAQFAQARLTRDLKQKGVAGTIIREVMEQCLTMDDELANARKAAEKKLRLLNSTGKTMGSKAREALYRHLSSKGFTADIVRAAVNDTMDTSTDNVNNITLQGTLSDMEEKLP
jgi:regulatory protein